MTSKICNGCKNELTLDNFYKDTELKSGYRGKCKSCTKTKEQSRVYNHIPEEIRKCTICEKNKPIELFYIYKRSKNGYCSFCKMCHKNNKLKNVSKNKTLYSNTARKYKIKKYHTDIHYKIRCLLTGRILSAIKSNKNIASKTSKSSILLGCDINYFKSWIEHQFEPWMTWDNHGLLWHLDHVIPCASFDLTITENQYKCFNWKNYQPLEKITNSSKNDKIIDELINSHNIKVLNYINLNHESG